MIDRDLCSGLIRLHILHHAAWKTIFGPGIIEELGRYGYAMSAGTLFPMLHIITTDGQHALAEAREKVRELFRDPIAFFRLIDHIADFFHWFNMMC